MRILVLYANPNPESFGAALCRAVVENLGRGGHEVDLCDLYAEGFDPVISAAERLAYHDLTENRRGVADYVSRLEAAEGLVLVYPVWNFGFPAILKGFFDRVFLPGVSFKMVAGEVRPNLDNLRLIAAVTTYGASRFRATLAGDPPRRIVTRVLHRLVAPKAKVQYLALYDMNRQSQAGRAMFLARIGDIFRRL